MDYEFVGIVVGFTLGLAPAAALIWLKAFDTARASMQSADQSALEEKANPATITK